MTLEVHAFVLERDYFYFSFTEYTHMELQENFINWAVGSSFSVEQINLG